MPVIDYFEFWDNFITNIQASANQADYNANYGMENPIPQLEINPFNFPIGIANDGIYNPIINPTYNFLPEPYWGWTPESTEELKIVVVNYNPAQGGILRNAILGGSYSGYVQNEVNNFVIGGPQAQPLTNKWHNTRPNSFVPFFLPPLVGGNSLKNYLGIDLVPWHSKKANEIYRYLAVNSNAVFDCSIKFAIEAANEINPLGILYKKVFVRSSWKVFRDTFNDQFVAGTLINVSGNNNPDFNIGNIYMKRVNVQGEGIIIGTLYIMWYQGGNHFPGGGFMPQMFDWLEAGN